MIFNRINFHKTWVDELEIRTQTMCNQRCLLQSFVKNYIVVQNLAVLDFSICQLSNFRKFWDDELKFFVYIL